MEQTRRRRRGHQGRDFPAPARLAEDGDVARIAAELGGVVMHPAQRLDDVELADIAAVGEAGIEVGQVEVAEGVEPVVHRDHDHVAPVRQPVADRVEAVRRAGGIAAAMQPDHHRPLLPVTDAWRPYIQGKAVFTRMRGFYP